MRLVTSSDCSNKGTNIGFPYNGPAPDLGCFESSVLAREVTLPATTVENIPVTGLSVFPNPVGEGGTRFCQTANIDFPFAATPVVFNNPGVVSLPIVL